MRLSKQKKLIFFILGIFLLQIITLFGTSNGSADIPSYFTDTTDTTTVTPELITMVPYSLTKTSDNIENKIQSTYSYMTGCGGTINVQPAPQFYIDTNNIQYTFQYVETDPTNGTQFAIYRADIPFEREYNIYTVYSVANVNPNGNLPSRSNSADGRVITSRVYIGEKSYASQQDGWLYGGFDKPAGDLCLQSIQDEPFQYEWTGYHDKYRSYSRQGIILTDYYGDDGNDNFMSRQKTEVLMGNIPFMKLNTEISRSDALGYDPYTRDTNLLTDYSTNPAFNIGEFNVGFRFNLQPYLGIKAKFNLNTDGTSYLDLNNTWSYLTGVKLLTGNTPSTNFDRRGFLGLQTDIDGNLITSLNVDDGQYHALENNSQSDLTINSDTALENSGMSETTTQVTIRLIPEYAKPKITRLATQTEGFYKYPNGIDAKSEKTGKYLSEYTTTDFQKNQFDDPSWIVELKGIQLAPIVGIHKKTTSLHYDEYWIDTVQNSRSEAFPKNYLIDTLNGYSVYQAFIHQRIRATVTVFSKYVINIAQGDDAYSLSSLYNPSNPTSGFLLDTDNLLPSANYTIPKTGIASWLDGLFGGLLGQFWDQYGWYIIIGVIVIGGIIALVVISRLTSFIPSASTPDRASRQALQLQERQTKLAYQAQIRQIELENRQKQIEQERALLLRRQQSGYGNPLR